jgi:uncharacterized repeat protein (TIGR03803 family)
MSHAQKSYLSCLFAFLSGVFVLSIADGARAASFTVIHDFQQSDGAYPEGGLVADKGGNLYGTTWSGGPDNGLGTVFRIAPDVTYTVLYFFCPNQDAGCLDGSGPNGALAIDDNGNLFGTTSQGGGGVQCPGGCGTVFEITSTGKENVIYAFQGGEFDGEDPESGIMLDPAGNLFGTTQYGGEVNVGTVFEITNSGTEYVLHAFAGDPDGVYPVGTLVSDQKGNIYGTSAGVQTGRREQCGEGFCGTIFRVADGGGYEQLYAFCSRTKCKDGGAPLGNLVVHRDMLFGTMAQGGREGCNHAGWGTVFALALGSNLETVLHDFAGGADGARPAAGHVLDDAGTLAGTTFWGGAPQCRPTGCGTIFALNSGTNPGRDSRANPVSYRLIHAFHRAQGANPVAPLLLYKGSYYGTTEYGGSCGCGTLFRVDK